MVLRFGILIGSIFLAYSLLLFHVYQLQLVKGGYYLARAESQYLGSTTETANRGLIYFTDKNGNRLPAVLNKDFPIVYAVPKAIEDPSETANTLAPLVHKPVADLVAILSKPNDSYEVLMRKADPDLAQQVADLNIKGIYVDTIPGRYYPLGTLASQVLGFVGPSSNNNGEVGLYGIEKLYGDALAGTTVQISGSKMSVPQPGGDITLTIDPNIQTEAERILENLVKTYNASGGTVIVEDPQTGKVLAMGSTPDFDPNNYSSSSISNFLNPALQQIYEPGSVFKVFTMAAGIDSGKLTPDTTYYDNGTLTLNGRTISNYDLKTHGPYGTATMTNVIEHSINTGAAFAEQRTGNDVFTKYIAQFGFGEKTGIDLPGEVRGNISRLNPKERQIAFATASYGQGVAVTPIELISAMAAIANKGTLVRPYLNADLAEKPIREVITPETAREVTNMMISAVDKANVAKINGYSLAGKTGSAFVPDFKNGGYTDRLIDSYVGFGPTSDPKFIILFKINDLDSSQLAALSVVPAFRDLAQFILNYYNIQPDRIVSQ